jgi:tetratricopeptide (TPR) repeat protein
MSNVSYIHDETPQQLLELALSCLCDENYQDCFDITEKIIQVAPDAIEAMMLNGLSAYHLEKYKLAIKRFKYLLTMVPNHAELHFFLGRTYLATHEKAAAHHHLETAYKLDSDSHDICFCFAGLLKEEGEYFRAISLYEKSIKLSPLNSGAWVGIAQSLEALGEHIEAKELYMRASILGQSKYDKPAASAFYNLATYFFQKERFEETKGLFNQVLTVIPDHAESLWHLALIDLCEGHLQSGFEKLESRWRMMSGKPERRDQLFNSDKEWHGESLKNKTIVILQEQGVGDELLFATCYADIIAQAEKTIIECDPRLTTLLQRSHPMAQFVGYTTDQSDIHDYQWLERQPFDYYSAAGSLQRYCRTDIQDFTQGATLLQADNQLQQYWRKTLPQGFKVGLCWRGGLGGQDRDPSYTSIEEWQKTLDLPNVSFINLVHDATNEEQLLIPSIAGLDLKNDMESTSALLVELDLVISVASWIAELSANVGTNTWRLTNGVDWTLLGESTRPWFPQMKIWQKSFFSPWDKVLFDIKENLGRKIVEGQSAKKLS